MIYIHLGTCAMCQLCREIILTSITERFVGATAVEPVWWGWRSLNKNTQISSFAQHSLYTMMFILPDVKDHLSWETTKFSGRFIQISLYNNYSKSFMMLFMVIASKSLICFEKG